MCINEIGLLRIAALWLGWRKRSGGCRGHTRLLRLEYFLVGSFDGRSVLGRPLTNHHLLILVRPNMTNDGGRVIGATRQT